MWVRCSEGPVWGRCSKSPLLLLCQNVERFLVRGNICGAHICVEKGNGNKIFEAFAKGMLLGLQQHIFLDDCALFL